MAKRKTRGLGFAWQITGAGRVCTLTNKREGGVHSVHYLNVESINGKPEKPYFGAAWLVMRQTCASLAAKNGRRPRLMAPVPHSSPWEQGGRVTLTKHGRHGGANKF